jgi:hypothetical protein
MQNLKCIVLNVNQSYLTQFLEVFKSFEKLEILQL